MTPDWPTRVQQAAEVIAEHLTGGYEQRLAASRAIAAQALEAAEREPPKWPSDETLRLLADADGDDVTFRCTARRALLTDPIIQAATLAVKYWESVPHSERFPPLVAAVKEAGL